MTPQQLKQTNILFNSLEYYQHKDSINNELIILYEEQLDDLYLADSIQIDYINELNDRLEQSCLDINELLYERDKINKKKNITTGFGIGSLCLNICLALLLLL